jgi:hypothetical protein
MNDFVLGWEGCVVVLRNWRRYLVIGVTAFINVLPDAVRADFQVSSAVLLQLFISGTITEQDAKSLQELSAEMERNNLFTLLLDSKGGDVFAAMQIGRLIRKYDGSTVIGFNEKKQGAKCYSSCALIFIAGVDRIIHSGGQLGLHRPYLSSIPQGRQVVEKQVPLVLSQVKQYVDEMGITDNFYQQMVNTKPSQMAIYREDNYTELVPSGLNLTLGAPAGQPR